MPSGISSGAAGASALGGPTGVAVGAGLSLLGGLFGGNNSAYNSAIGNANRNADTLSDLRDWYGTQAADQNAFYNGDNAKARSGALALENYYQTNPNNNASYARDLAAADNGLNSNIARMKLSNLGSAAANGQMVAGGTQSGTTAGVNAYLSGLNALGISGNQVNVANTNQQNLLGNMQNYYGLTSGMANQDYSNTNQATGNEGNLTSQLMDYYNNQANSQLGQDQNYGSALLGGLGSMGGSLGSIFGGGKAKNASST